MENISSTSRPQAAPRQQLTLETIEEEEADFQALHDYPFGNAYGKIAEAVSQLVEECQEEDGLVYDLPRTRTPFAPNPLTGINTSGLTGSGFRHTLLSRNSRRLDPRATLQFNLREGWVDPTPIAPPLPVHPGQVEQALKTLAKKPEFNPEAFAFTPGGTFPATKPTSSALRPRVSMTPLPPARISAKSIVANLLNAMIDSNAPIVTISIAFASRCFGPAFDQHLVHSDVLGRVILRSDSPLRRGGVELGLPQEYVDWLCGEGEQTDSVFTIRSAVLFERRCAHLRK